MTPSSATGLDEKALENATAYLRIATMAAGSNTAKITPWSDIATATIRAYMSALTVTSFPPAEQHDVTSRAVPHDGEGAVASDFMSLAAHLAKVNAGRPVVEGSETGVYVHRDVCIEAMQALLASSPTPPTAPAVPAAEGWVLVPREPTEAMVEAGIDALREHTELLTIARDPLFVWRYMLSALPAQPNSSEGEPT
jgi:hypothetical protein